MAFPELVKLIRNGDVDGVNQYLTDHHAHLAEELFMLEDGETLLHLVAKQKSMLTQKCITIINALVAAANRLKPNAPEEFLDRPNSLKFTPLHSAVLAGNVSAVQAFLAVGANPLVENSMGASPLETATSKLTTQEHGTETLKQIAELLLDHFAGLYGTIKPEMLDKIEFSNRVTIGMRCLGRSFDDICADEFTSASWQGHNKALKTLSSLRDAMASKSDAERPAYKEKIEIAVNRRLQLQAQKAGSKQANSDRENLCILARELGLTLTVGLPSLPMTKPAVAAASSFATAPVSFHHVTPSLTPTASAAAAPPKRSLRDRLFRR